MEGGGMSADSLSSFVAVTGADPALAQDILSAAGGDVEAAVHMYNEMMGLDHLSSADDQPPPPYPGPSDTDEEMEQVLRESREAHLKKESEQMKEDSQPSQKWLRKKGIVCVKPDVLDRFHQESKFKCSRVDVGEELVSTIDEKFFQHTFLFPDVMGQDPPDFVEFLSNDLLELSHKSALEKTGYLNWWSATGQCPPLEPLATRGDGNCLLHAASLGMWGIPDSSLILRTAVHKFLTSSKEAVGVQRRWRFQTELNYQRHGGFTLNDSEWDEEWKEILRIARSEGRHRRGSRALSPMGKAAGADSDTMMRRTSTLRVSYESLEEIHVFVLAHVLKRPVIVLANKVLQNIHGQDLAPIYFSGIYLPLECNPKHCIKSPIVLAYEASHFSPLLAKDMAPAGKKKAGAVLKANLRNSAVIPLVTPDGHLLPLQFVVNPEKDNTEELLRLEETASKGDFPPHYITLLESYLDIRWISLARNPFIQQSNASSLSHPEGEWQVPSVRFPAAQISYQARPAYQEELLRSYLSVGLERYEELVERRQVVEAEKQRRQEDAMSGNLGGWEHFPCVGVGCSMFGNAETNFLCSQCYKAGLGATEEDKGESASGASLSVPDLAPSHDSRSGHQTYPAHDPAPEQNPPQDSGPSLSSAQADTLTSSTQPRQPVDIVTSRHTLTAQVPGEGNMEPQTRSAPSTAKSTVAKAANPPPAVASGSSESQQPDTPASTGDVIQGQVNVRAADVAKIIAQKVNPEVPFLRKKEPARAPGGYKRDHIRPLRKGEEAEVHIDLSSKQQVECKAEDCQFFGSQKYEGFCSQCCKKVKETEQV